MLSPDFLTGKDESDLVAIEPGSRIKLHEDVVPQLDRMRKAASKEGFDPLVVSGFRGFDHQLRIWNEKATGKRPVRDENNVLLDFEARSPEAMEKRFFAMLRWSAFPGLSRHHWGSDFDIVDRKAMPEGYQVQLVPEEVEGDGLFAPFHDWLDEQLEEYRFFRPYQTDRGGVSPERWHISYEPLSSRCLKDFSEDLFKKILGNRQIEMRDLALKHLDLLWNRYFQNIDLP
jgi:LAS superfamily LD-carboxypeptidase LdcB